ncbi:hypothetical protein LXL04_028523 [Taraxacum kok-saghyz]
MDTNIMDVDEDTEINVVRTDIDVYFRDNSTYDETLNIDSLFINDDDLVVDQVPSKSSSSSDSGFFEERLYSEGEFSSMEIKSADGSKTDFWILNVPEPILPRKDMIFEDLHKGIDFYTKYAYRAGFDIKLASEKIVNSKKAYKYVICSRSGKAELNKANLGAVRAHGIVTGFKGGVDKQCAKKVNYKNFARNLNCYIKDSDANLIFNLLENRADSIPYFYFYHLLEDSKLMGVFGANSIAKRK